MFVKRHLITYDVNRVFEYHTRKGALDRLIPPWSGLNSVSQKGGINNYPISIFQINLGLGIRIGNGDHYISWVSIEDVIKSIFYYIINTSIEGAVNVVSPHPVTNLGFSCSLKRIFNPKLSISMNKNLTKLIFGQMSDELLSTDTFVIPKKLVASGYKFTNPELDDTLRFLLGKMKLE